MKVSPTQLQVGLDDKCPRKYVKKYVTKDMPRTKNNRWAVLGTVVHSVFEQLYKFELFKNVKYLLNILDKNFKEEFSKKNIEYVSERDLGFLKKYAIENVTKGYSTLKETGLLIPPISTEEKFEVHLLPSDEDGATQTGNRIVGIIDAIFELNDRYLIIDYKTGKEMPSQEELDKNIQLTAYSYVVYKLYNQPCDSALLFTRHKKLLKSKKKKKSDYSFLIKDIESLSVYENVVDANEIPIKPSQKACFFCELRVDGSCEGPRKIGMK